MNIRQFVLLVFTFLLINIFGTNLAFADTVFDGTFDLQNAALVNNNVYNMTKNNSPYIFNGGFYVTQNITVNVEPGVEIILNNGYAANFSKGNFNFNGTKEETIKIHSGNSSPGVVIASTDSIESVNLKLNNVEFSNFRNCLYIGSNTNVEISDISLSGCYIYPIYINSNANINIQGVKYVGDIGNFDKSLIHVTANDSSINPLILNIKDTTFEYNPVLRYVLFVEDYNNPNIIPDATKIKFSNNTFLNYPAGAQPMVFRDGVLTPVDATGNYWGSDAGPYHTGDTPTNGPQLPVNVSYVPYLTVDPNSVKECCSSVLFIPGIEGSRLYKDRLLFGSDQLWEANTGSDLSDLGMDTNGDSINPDIYTSDVIDKTNLISDDLEKIIGNYDKNIYKSILDYLQTQVSNNVIKSYKAYPYDWRINFDEIINNGTKLPNNTTSKLVEVLRQQAKLSDTGKVTIMAHSMGGLLTKRFIQTLEPKDQTLIDKVVFIAVPEIGTPEGASSVLNGIDFSGFYKTLVSQKYTRKLAENMTNAHLLSPSDAYFNMVGVKPIKFNDDVLSLLPQLSMYGTDINTGIELRNFLSGVDGRPDASFSDVNYPNISPSSVIDKAKNIHGQIDNYDIPNSIKTFQIVGLGIPTIKQIEFVKKVLPDNTSEVSYKLYKNLAGDGTVVKESADYFNAPAYYVDLNKYNNNTKSNIEHKNITESNSVMSIVGNIIKNEEISTDSYISKNANSFDALQLFTAGIHSPVDIHLYDSLGNHTGPVYVDFNGQKIKFIEENIPNTSYDEYGEDKYITGIDDQLYTIKLDGYDSGKFTFDLQRYVGDTATTYETFNNLPSNELLSSSISLSPNTQISSIMLDVNSDGDMDLQAKNNGTIINLHEHDCSGKEKDLKNQKEKDKVCKN